MVEGYRVGDLPLQHRETLRHTEGGGREG
eukprot:COSAG03_NODE_18823_length_347_cov_1.758065_2_plen_28_part_01